MLIAPSFNTLQAPDYSNLDVVAVAAAAFGYLVSLARALLERLPEVLDQVGIAPHLPREPLDLLVVAEDRLARVPEPLLMALDHGGRLPEALLEGRDARRLARDQLLLLLHERLGVEMTGLTSITGTGCQLWLRSFDGVL